MESMIADLTVGAGNSAPEIELNTNLLSNITTDLEPEVQVRVNSIQVKNLTANPSLVIAASKVTLADADETPSEDVSDSLQYISETPVQVELSIGNYSSSEVNTAVGKLKLYKNGTSPSDSISSLIRFYKSEYSRNFDQLVNLYLKDTTINGLDSVINILKKETGLNRKMQLAQTYIAKKDYTNAHQVLNNLQQYPELNNFVSMQNIFITLKEQNKSLFEIKTNSSLYQTVRFIADDSLHSGYSAARAILNLIDEIHYPEVIRFNNTSPSYRLRKEEVGFATGQILLRNYPNPFYNQTIIEAKIDDKLIQPMLVIYDLLGKEIFKSKLHGGFNEVAISENTLNAGVYFYSIVSDDKKIATAKMICTR